MHSHNTSLSSEDGIEFTRQSTGVSSVPDDEPFFAILASNIDNIIDIIDGSNSINTNTVPTQYGKTIQPFGIARLKLVELLSYAIKVSNIKVSRELAVKKIFSKLMVFY